MTMRATTVRFSDDLWAMLEREASRDGVSAAQFVRDATLLRIGALAGRRGDTSLQASVQELVPRAQRRVARPGVGDAERLRAVRATGLLDTPPESQFDRLTELVRRVLAAPVALISLIEEERQFFKSQGGLPEPWGTTRQTPLSHSFCRHMVTTREPLIVNDARQHPVLRDNPAVPDLGVVAYLGIPLIVEDGLVLGGLCAIDHQARFWTSEQVGMLSDLAQLTLSEIRLATPSR